MMIGLLDFLRMWQQFTLKMALISDEYENETRRFLSFSIILLLLLLLPLILGLVSMCILQIKKEIDFSAHTSIAVCFFLAHSFE